MRAKFLTDANFDLVILAAAKRREPALDFQTAQETGLAGMEAPDVLAVAAREGRVLLTHDVRTMPRHFAAFIGAQTSAGVLLVPQSLPRRRVVEDLRLIWVAMEAGEWINRIGCKHLMCGYHPLMVTDVKRKNVRRDDSAFTWD